MAKNQFLSKILWFPAICVYNLASSLDQKRRILFSKNFTPPKTPLVVVGALKAGGSGKTSLTMELAQFLKSKNLKPVILCKWLNKKWQDQNLSEVQENNVEKYSDEAVLLKLKTNCDVYVCANRKKAWQALDQMQKYSVILSDDGFQDCSLKGAQFLLLQEAFKSPGFWDLLPRGNYREKANAQKRAHSIFAEPNLSQQADKNPGQIFRSLVNLQKVVESGPFIGVFSQGDPQKFFSELNALGIHFLSLVFLKNHQKIPLELLEKQRELYPDAPFLITEKEWVKWPKAPKFSNYLVMLQKLEIPPQFLSSFYEQLRHKLSKNLP